MIGWSNATRTSRADVVWWLDVSVVSAPQMRSTTSGMIVSPRM
jgi:hypothetical protein